MKTPINLVPPPQILFVLFEGRLSLRQGEVDKKVHSLNCLVPFMRSMTYQTRAGDRSYPTLSEIE